MNQQDATDRANVKHASQELANALSNLHLGGGESAKLNSILGPVLRGVSLLARWEGDDFDSLDKLDLGSTDNFLPGASTPAWQSADDDVGSTGNLADALAKIKEEGAEKLASMKKQEVEEL